MKTGNNAGLAFPSTFPPGGNWPSKSVLVNSEICTCCCSRTGADGYECILTLTHIDRPHYNITEQPISPMLLSLESPATELLQLN